MTESAVFNWEHRLWEDAETGSQRGWVLWNTGMLVTRLWAGLEDMDKFWGYKEYYGQEVHMGIRNVESGWVLGTWISITGKESVIPSPETLSSPSVTQPKRTFTTVRTPKDIASENSISRCVATPWPLSCGTFRERLPQGHCGTDLDLELWLGLEIDVRKTCD